MQIVGFLMHRLKYGYKTKLLTPYSCDDSKLSRLLQCSHGQIIRQHSDVALTPRSVLIGQNMSISLTGHFVSFVGRSSSLTYHPVSSKTSDEKTRTKRSFIYFMNFFLYKKGN